MSATPLKYHGSTARHSTAQHYARSLTAALPPSHQASKAFLSPPAAAAVAAAAGVENGSGGLAPPEAADVCGGGEQLAPARRRRPRSRVATVPTVLGVPQSRVGPVRLRPCPVRGGEKLREEATRTQDAEGKEARQDKARREPPGADAGRREKEIEGRRGRGSHTNDGAYYFGKRRYKYYIHVYSTLCKFINTHVFPLQTQKKQENKKKTPHVCQHSRRNRGFSWRVKPN